MAVWRLTINSGDWGSMLPLAAVSERTETKVLAAPPKFHTCSFPLSFGIDLLMFPLFSLGPALNASSDCPSELMLKHEGSVT
jgi:hypothetical protein